jgi:cytoskeleton protein RodZ
VADGDLQTLGMLLRQTREANALSLEEVEEQTRIRVKFLRALESGDMSLLPSVAHAKGFLRNYAQFLHLDANAIVAEFVALTGSGTTPITTTTAAVTPPPPPPAYPGTPAFEEPPAQPDSIPLPAIPRPSTNQGGKTRPVYIAPGQQVGPAGPLGMGRAEATDANIARQRSARPAPKRVFRSGWIVGVVLAVGMVVTVWWAITQLSAISGDELIPTEQIPISAGAAAVAVTDALGLTEAQPTSESTPTAGIPILDRVLLTMTVTQRTWVRIVQDGEVAFEGQAVPGDLLQYTGSQSIVVVAGNGGGLSASYNGQDIGPLGSDGQAVEVIFTPSGRTTPTATPTLTPTSTDVPTATPRVSQTPTPHATETATRKP